MSTESIESTEIKSISIYTQNQLLDDLKNKLKLDEYNRIIYSIGMIKVGATTWDKDDVVGWILTQYKRFNLTYNGNI